MNTKKVLGISKRLWSLMLLIYCLQIPPIFAADYYVATDGKDRRKCGGPNNECRTIDYALKLVKAGDTIKIRPGTYVYPGRKELDIDDPANDNFKRMLDFRYQPQVYILSGEGQILYQWIGAPSRDELVTAFEIVLAQ